MQQTQNLHLDVINSDVDSPDGEMDFRLALKALMDYRESNMTKIEDGINSLDENKESVIAESVVSTYWNGLKVFTDFATSVRDSVLTGLSTITSTAITATDTVLSAFGKLQGQLNLKVDKLTGVTAGTFTKVTTNDQGQVIDGTNPTTLFDYGITDAAPTNHASDSTTYGVADASNYGHAKASSATPSMDGTASAGLDNGLYARDGHVHPSDETKASKDGTLQTNLNAEMLDGKRAGDFAANPNFIINGGFDIWQIGTTFTDIASKYTADMWSTETSGGTTGDIIRIETDGSEPFKAKYYYKYHKKNPLLGILVYKDDNLFRTHKNTVVTVSYWARAESNVSTIFQVATPGEIFATTVYLNTEWQYFTHTFNTQNGSTNFMKLLFLRNGTVGVYYIANVKLEIGDTATPFIPRPFAEELALCQRYFEKSYNTDVVPGTITNAGRTAVTIPSGARADLFVEYKVTKRVTPTVTLYSPITGGVGKFNLTTTTVGESTDYVPAQSSAAGMSGTNFYNGVAPTVNSQLSAHWTADARL